MRQVLSSLYLEEDVLLKVRVSGGETVTAEVQILHKALSEALSRPWQKIYINEHCSNLISSCWVKRRMCQMYAAYLF